MGWKLTLSETFFDTLSETYYLNIKHETGEKSSQCNNNKFIISNEIP